MKIPRFWKPSRVRRDIASAPNLGSSIVTVVVGSDDRVETFLVHESILRASSARANTCLTRPCKEEKERRILLPNFEPATFRTYMHFLHTGLMYTIHSQNQNQIGNIGAGALALQNTELGRCLQSYRLAAHLEAPDFADATVDAITEIMTDLRSKYPTTKIFLTDESVKFLYTCSSPGSPVRNLIVDWGLIALDHTGFDPDMDFRSEDQFLCDLFVALRPFWVGESGVSELVDPFGELVGCRYHEHLVVGRPCYKDRFG